MIVGKIAALVTERIINRGKEQGVIEGMIFCVEKELPPIIDPDDHTIALIGAKVTLGLLKVQKVYDNMSFTTN